MYMLHTNIAGNKPDSVVVGLSDGVTEADPLVVVAVVVIGVAAV